MFELTQNTDQWLAFRRDKIGASDAPVIMGDSPWSTPYQRWQEKLGLIAPKKTTKAMQWGLDQEQTARDIFRLHTEIEVKPQVTISLLYPWMIASMDGVSENGHVGVEIKCPGVADHESAKRNLVPTKYYAQLQHQHAVGEFDKLFYASLGKDGTFALFEVPRDDKYISKLIEKEKEFYDCICNFEPPNLCDSDYNIHFDDEFKTAAEGWLEAKTQAKAFKAKEEEYRRRLIALSDGRPSKGHGVKMASHPRKGAVDYGYIEDLIGINFEQYRKPPTTVWLIQEEKE